MKPEIKQKWITALRSGKYRQGSHSLFNGVQYCCLGVLCDLYLKENNIKEGDEYFWKFESFDRFQNQYNIPLSKGILPPYIASHWAEIGDRNPIMSDGRTISLHNDEGDSFEQIAELIEKEL